MTTRRTSRFGAGRPRLSERPPAEGRWRFARGPGRGNREGFTLLEVLVVVAIMVAITALVLPGMYSRGGSSSQEDVVDVVDAAVLQAKARSARTGQTAAVCMREEADGSIRVMVTSGPGLSSRDGDRAGAAGSSTKEETVGVIRQSKARGADGSKAGSESGGAKEARAGVEGEDGDGTTLAIMTPDGAVHPAQSTGVRLGEQGESHTVAVDGFGVVHINHGQSSSVDGAGDEDGMDGLNAVEAGVRQGADGAAEERGYLDAVTSDP